MNNRRECPSPGSGPEMWIPMKPGYVELKRQESPSLDPTVDKSH